MLDNKRTAREEGSANDATRRTTSLCTVEGERMMGETLKRTAEEAVQRLKRIEGIALFGSRARDDHHEESDWDIVVITDNKDEGNEAAQKLGELPRVCPVVMGAGQIRARCNTAGTIESSIARQARPVAGKWRRPRCRKKGLDVNNETVQRFIEDTTEHVRSAFQSWFLMHERNRIYAGHAVSQVQMAAEKLAKSILSGHGIAFETSHFLDRLASQLQEQYTHGAFSQEEVGELARKLRDLDGGTHLAHMAWYFPDPVETHETTVTRLARTMALQPRWITSYGAKHTDAREAMRWLGKDISRGAEQIAANPWFTRTEEQLQQASVEWARAGATIEAGGRIVVKVARKGATITWRDIFTEEEEELAKCETDNELGQLMVEKGAWSEENKDEKLRELTVQRIEAEKGRNAGDGG